MPRPKALKPPVQQAPKFKCTKCGHTQATLQVLRTKVMVGGDIGIQVSGLAQWMSCLSCGDQTLPYVFEHGNPVPVLGGAQVVGQPPKKTTRPATKGKGKGKGKKVKPKKAAKRRK